MDYQQALLEKRSYSRYRVKLPIQYRLLETPMPQERDKGKVALAKNLSQEGLFLKIAPDKDLRTGEVIRLDITLPDLSKHLFAFGEVIWVNRLGTGVHLMLMPEEDRQLLKGFVEQMAYS
jgi:Tfp pilus assembly protein PilZ